MTLSQVRMLPKRRHTPLACRPPPAPRDLDFVVRMASTSKRVLKEVGRTTSHTRTTPRTPAGTSISHERTAPAGRLALGDTSRLHCRTPHGTLLLHSLQ